MRNLDPEPMRERLDDIHAERQQLHAQAGDDRLDAQQQARWNALDAEEDELRELLAEAERAAERYQLVAASRAKYGSLRVGPHDPGISLGSGSSSAMRSIDAAHGRGEIPSAGAELMEHLVSTGSPDERSMAAEWAQVTTDPAYLRAFAAIVADPTRGHLRWTREEQAAYQRVAALAGREKRAALATSGYVLPASVDPVVQLTNDGAISALADVARRETMPMGAGDSWRGITSTGATHEWKTENSEAADGTPPAAEVEIPLFSSVINATFSYEVEMSSVDLLNQLSNVLRDAASVAWAAAFVTGNGTTQPQGIITALDGSSQEISGQGTEAIASTDPYDLLDDLGARFTPGAAFLSSLSVANQYRQLETANGSWHFPELRQTPPMLAGLPWHQESSMQSFGDFDTGATADNFLLALGDWQRAFIIVNQLGSRLEILPAYGANGRPQAARHMLLFTRVGSEVVVPEAARVLNIATTA